MSIDKPVPPVKWVRDNRGRNWFWSDNDVFDVMAAHIGVNALATYLYLCRCADNSSQECHPSYKRIGDRTGTSRPTAKRSIATLIAHGMIRRDAREAAIGDSDTNLYTLLPREAWEIPSDHSVQGEVTQTPPPVQEGSGWSHTDPTGGVTQTPKQDTENKTQKQDSSTPSAARDDELEASLVSELRQHGVSVRIARELARDFPRECRRQIDLLPLRKVQKPGPYLPGAIRDDYDAPAQGVVAPRDENADALRVKAYQKVYDSLHPSSRAAADAHTGGKWEYLHDRYPDRIRAALVEVERKSG